MTEINNIEKFIDKILDKPKWKDMEMKFYDLLQRKVAQYSQKTKTYDLILEKRDIIDNIHEQIWFKNSKYQNHLSSILNEMEIEIYDIDMKDHYIKNQLSVKFPKSKFWLHSYYSLVWDDTGKRQIQLYIYLEDFGQVNRAYIAYNDLRDEHGLGENIKLPQIAQVFNVIKIGAHVSKIELLKLFSEIVLYYDESELIAKSHIGQQFPITLTYILTKL